VVVLGARFDDFVIGNHAKFCAEATLVHVDIDASEINKIKDAHIPIQGDVKLVIKAFNEVITKKLSIQPWIEQVLLWKAEFAHQYPKPKETIVPQDVIVKLKKQVNDDVIVSVGVGQFQLWTAQLFGFKSPRTFLSSASLAAKGFGLPAAIGAQMAYPKRQVIDIEGDGNFLRNIQELQTLKALDIPIKCIVFNNQHMGMVALWENKTQKNLSGQTFLGETDFVAIANVFGVKGERICRTDQIEAALQRLLAYEGPYILDVQYPYAEASHGHVSPMIPGDGSYLDTIMWDGTTLREYLQGGK
ncbi:MAG TPA: thiamine pyrophosphate-dependent enzyme, partial [bacterium]|nr:thiamine pyrophosphate-dependent enzyme [bacterium]